MVKAILFALVLVIATGNAALSESLFSYFWQSDDHKSATLSFSPCGPEEGECEAYELSCREGTDTELSIIYAPVDVGRMAASLIVDTEGNVLGHLRLSGDLALVPIDIHEIRVYRNDADGGWILVLALGSENTFFDALTAASSEGAKFEVGGEAFALSPQPGDGAKLMEIKAACAGMRSDLL